MWSSLYSAEIILRAIFLIQQIHTNVTADSMNVFSCQCHSPWPACTPSPRLFKMYFIHRVTVLVVYLINMTAQHTQHFFQFYSFNFLHFRLNTERLKLLCDCLRPL